ncbi:MAG: hypothetical protein J7M20_01735, partial [Deltaproteobacteria bacterium]|nr:hypothetical protein [Deltaproteobacteria bacterium]
MKKKTGFTGHPSIIAKLFLLTGTLLFLVFGVGFAHADSTQTGVIATGVYGSSYAISTISVNPKAGPRNVLNDLLPGDKGSTVKAFGQYYYRIEQNQADNITKVDIAAPNTPIWQYSTMDPGEIDSSNPYDLVFVNSTKAYLIRYGSTKVWIVNPSVSRDNEAGFKIGELDLSAYAGADGVPDMCCGVIANGKLFIVMQRLVDFCPSEIAYVAVFDTTTDTEINTGLGSGSMIGIPLIIKDPMSIQYVAENNLIYVQGVGSFPGYCDPAYDYTGGIVSINPIDYTSSIVLDDGDAATHPYGVISGMLIASPTKGYFVGYAGWGDNTLYAFNPTTSVVSGALTDFQNINISGMNSGTYLDKNDMMWVCDSTNAAIKIVDTADNILNESIPTNLNPLFVAFCTQGTPLAPTLGSTVSGNNLMAHWNTVSGAEGYYLWISA